MHGLIAGLLLILWVMCWVLGGWWMVRAAFKLNPAEEGMLGLVVGLAAEVGLVNFAARVISLPWATWLSALIVLCAGLILALHHGGLAALKIKIVPGQWLAFVLITYVFFLISRGLAIYDDYAHLPTLSIMATGQIPPHFAYDPQVPYRYHYFLLLFGAQIMRLAGWQPWTAWDAARALTIAPAVLLGGMWAFRVTRNRLVGWVGAAGVLFISGTRWLLLFIPDSILAKISAHVNLIGAGAAAGKTLLMSMANPWPVEGQGSFPFPYAFQNGIFTSGTEAVHAVIGLMLVAVLFALLLTATRWRNNWGALVSIILISSIGLLDEVELPLLAAAMVILTLGWMIHSHGKKLPLGLKWWWLVWLVSSVIVAVEGGAWTDTLVGIFNRLLGQAAPPSYQSIGFQLAAPAIISNQLGTLSLLNINTILVALVEIGPIIFTLPLLVYWGLKAARSGRWYEATLLTATILSLAMIFVQFTGSTGERNTSRLYIFVPICAVMAVPAVWLWVSHRPRFIQTITGILGGVTMLGGLVMLGVQLPNIKNYQFSYFIAPIDARMEEIYWNKLEANALVFDPTPSRAATIFGRNTDAGFTWYAMKPTFVDLVSSPDAYKLFAAGFSYAYISQNYWEKLTQDQQAEFDQPCIVLMHEEIDPGADKDWRKLYDIRQCHK